MLTDQNYGQSTSDENRSTQAVDYGPAADHNVQQRAEHAERLRSRYRPVTITVQSELCILVQKPIELNWLRQDLRAWFMAYVPQEQSNNSGPGIDISVMYYQMLDEFLSELIEMGIDALSDGQNTVPQEPHPTPEQAD